MLILNDDVIFQIMTYQQPTNIIFLNEVNKRFYDITKKNFTIKFPTTKEIINDMEILSWAYNHGWKIEINLSMLLTNYCSASALDYYNNIYSFSKRTKYYYHLATTIEQLDWLKKNRFRYYHFFFDGFGNEMNTKWMDRNLIFHQYQLLDYIISNPDDYEEIEYACENVCDLRNYVHTAAVRTNNLPLLKWSAKKFQKEFNLVKVHEDLFILAAENGDIDTAKFLLKHQVPFTGLTLKIAREEEYFDFVELLTTSNY